MTLTYLTLRPVKADNGNTKEWFTEASAALKEAELRAEVSYNYFQSLPIGRKVQLPLTLSTL